MRWLLAWLTDAPLAESIVGDLEEGRAQRGTLWFWSTLAGITGYAGWTRFRELAAGGPVRSTGSSIRDAVRVLRRRPGFTACTILLLALGIGANTAVFSVVRAVLLRPLPYADVERLAFVWGGPNTGPGNSHSIVTGKHVTDIARDATTIESYVAIKGWQTGLEGRLDLLLPDGAERLRGAVVTPNFFDFLGVRAAVGRAFSDADGSDAVAVISDAFWRRRFGADPRVIGRTVPVSAGRSARNGTSYTIVGVLPPEFRYSYPRETEAYLLLPWNKVRSSRALEYQMVVKLKPGVSIAQAQAELTSIAKAIVRTYDNLKGPNLEAVVARTSMMVEPVGDHLQAEVRPGLMLLAAVAALVLMIACVNLGLLMLARTVDRRGELGLRAALGAGTGRIVAQLLTESAVLSIAGGVVGLATAAAAMPVIRALMPPVVPRTDQIGIDPMVLGFALLLMTVTTLVCAIGPAWLVTRRDLLDEVRRSSTVSTGDRVLLVFRRLIVTVQVAVVVLLLVGSGLLLRSFWRLQHVDLGFRVNDVVTMEIRLLNPKHGGTRGIATFHEALMSRVRAIPGVARAGVTTSVPMRGVDFMYVVGPRGRPRQFGHMRSVDPEYFRIMQLQLKAGRVFTAEDSANSEMVAVVSESYGRLHFGNESPLGRTLLIDKEVTIVGVVGDVRYVEATRDPAPAFYLPSAQQPSELICLLVEPRPGMRTEVVDQLRTVVTSLDPEQPVEGITTVRQIVNESTADRRFYAVATGTFAGLALILSVAGVFGAVSRTVIERRRELALRVALGADPRRLLRLVYGYGLWPAAVGTAIGLSCALAGSRVLRTFLFEIAPTDVPTYAAAAALVFAVTAAACYVPAHRTLRMPPMFVLKSD